MTKQKNIVIQHDNQDHMSSKNKSHSTEWISVTRTAVFLTGNVNTRPLIAMIYNVRNYRFSRRADEDSSLLPCLCPVEPVRRSVVPADPEYEGTTLLRNAQIDIRSAIR